MSSWRCFGGASRADAGEAGSTRSIWAMESYDPLRDSRPANQDSAPQSTGTRAANLNVRFENNNHNFESQPSSPIVGSTHVVEATAATFPQVTSNTASSNKTIQYSEQEDTSSALEGRAPRLAPPVAPHRGPIHSTTARGHPKSIPLNSIIKTTNLASNPTIGSQSSIQPTGRVGTTNTVSRDFNPLSSDLHSRSGNAKSSNVQSSSRARNIRRVAPVESIRGSANFSSSPDNVSNQKSHPTTHGSAIHRAAPHEYSTTSANPSSTFGNVKSSNAGQAAGLDFITVPANLASTFDNLKTANTGAVNFITTPAWFPSESTNISTSNHHTRNPAGNLHHSTSIEVLTAPTQVIDSSNTLDKSKTLRSVRSRPSQYFRSKKMGSVQSKPSDNCDAMKSPLPFLGRRAKSGTDMGDPGNAPDAWELGNMFGGYNSNVKYECKVWSEQVHEPEHEKKEDEEEAKEDEDGEKGNEKEIEKKRKENARKVS